MVACHDWNINICEGLAGYSIIVHRTDWNQAHFEIRHVKDQLKRPDSTETFQEQLQCLKHIQEAGNSRM